MITISFKQFIIGILENIAVIDNFIRKKNIINVIIARGCYVGQVKVYLGG
tara:strand:- start:681 stop:830 length:150 start_codon:yes stop_codon:yes gene_type:complete